MPNIPTFVTAPGQLPGSGDAPRMGAGGVNAVAFETIQQGNRLADAANAFTEKYVQAKLQVDAADQTSMLSRQLSEVQAEASKIPDRLKATAHYDAATSKIYEDYENAGGNPLVRAAVSTRFTSERDLRRRDTQTASFQLESQTQRGKLITQLDGWGKEAADATDPRLRDKLVEDGLAAIDGRVAGGWMNPEAGAKAKVDFQSGVYRSLIEKAMASNPRYGIALSERYSGKLNAQDSHIVGVQTENQKTELKAEDLVNQRLPVLGSYGNVTHWGGHIEGAASSTGVRPSLIAAVASQESGGNANAISRAGAGGPMQFMEGTARDEGVSNRFDPREAIPKGAGYLKKQLDKYGDETTALMAYNWGPGNVDKWIKNGKNPADVPRETQEYVRSVQAKDKQFGRSASGDALAGFRTEALKAEQELLADNTMDPRVRSRALTILQQRSRATEGVVLSERKAAADEAETAAIGLFTGKYKDGTFATIAQKYRDTGDNSMASVYDLMAQNEGALKDFGNLPPGAQRTFANLLPGAAGKIAQSILTDQRTDRKEFREEAARQHALFTKGVSEGLDPAALAANARDAAAYYAAAGDAGKAKSVVDAYQGVVDGWRAGGKPTVEAEAELRRLKEIANGGTGLDAKTAAMLQTLEKGITKNRELWKNDALVAAEGKYIAALKPLTPEIFNDPLKLQVWANERAQQAATAGYVRDPQGNTQTVPMLNQTETDQIRDRLLKGTVQDRQVGLARLSTALPPDQVPLVATKIAGNDKLGDTWATAMAFYKRGLPGDRQIADSLVTGSNMWVEGGPEGKQKIELNPTTFSQINSLFGTAYRGDARVRDMQNNAIAARYVALRGGKDDAGVVDPTVLKQAASDIVGTPMRHNGVDLVLPSKVQPYQFEDALSTLQPTDMPPLRTAGGTPITADRVRRYATYQTVGDGIYRVWMPDPKRGGTTELVRADTGQPWDLDIRPLLTRATGQQGIPPRVEGIDRTRRERGNAPVGITE